MTPRRGPGGAFSVSRIAAIDVGSNTVRLLVAEITDARTWRIVDEHQTITRLGEGLARSGVLGDAPMARTLGVVNTYVARARGVGVDTIRIVATSAVRESSNGRAFAEAIGHATGQRVDVISGEEEARLTVRGVRHGLGELRGPVLVFDVGGGSTEYVLSEDDAVRAAVSLRLGVIPLAERFPFPAGIDWDRYRALEHEVRAQLARELPAAIRAAGTAHLVGTAGTVTTLAALDLGLTTYDPARVQGHALSRETVRRLLERVGALAIAERAALPCLDPGRADLIIPGIAIVMATFAEMAIDALQVSDYGLREGLLVEALERGRAAR